MKVPESENLRSMGEGLCVMAQIKVVISPGFGAGIATWNNKGYEFVEHPEVVALVERGGSSDEAHALAERLFPGEDFYLGGWSDAMVATVDGPYLIHEYDGSESIITPDKYKWRNTGA